MTLVEEVKTTYLSRPSTYPKNLTNVISIFVWSNSSHTTQGLMKTCLLAFQYEGVVQPHAII